MATTQLVPFWSKPGSHVTGDFTINLWCLRLNWFSPNLNLALAGDSTISPRCLRRQLVNSRSPKTSATKICFCRNIGTKIVFSTFFLNVRGSSVTWTTCSRVNTSDDIRYGITRCGGRGWRKCIVRRPTMFYCVRHNTLYSIWSCVVWWHREGKPPLPFASSLCTLSCWACPIDKLESTRNGFPRRINFRYFPAVADGSTAQLWGVRLFTA